MYCERPRPIRGRSGLEKRAGADGPSLMMLKLRFVRLAVALALISTAGVSLAANGNALQGRIQNNYSPYNKKRSMRPHTRYIVLHTTEGEDKGSLRVVTRSGLAHYFVSKSGRVYRIIHKSRIAKHAGVSMWEGLTNIDNYSIGIEVSGYHNRDITDAQYEVLRELIRQLQSLYDIPDEDVITHSMVAYGRPNYIHKHNWRGRKSCGMIFAKPEVRARLGLDAAPKRDPDVAAGRVKVGDKDLFKVLFPDKPRSTSVVASAKPATAKEPLTTAGNREPAADDRGAASSVAGKIAPLSTKSVSSKIEPKSYLISRRQTAWDIAGESYNHSSTLYIFPNGKKKTGDQIEDWAHIPANTRVILAEADNQPLDAFLEIGKDGDTAKEVAGTASTSSTTIYFFPDGFIRTGAELKSRRSYHKLLNNPPKETKVLLGYVYGGYVKGRRPASTIAGAKWNYPSTYYRYPNGRFVNGDDINDKEIPPGTLVFYQR